jgi:hypothetical protein
MAWRFGGSRSDLNAVTKRKNPFSRRESSLHVNPQLVTMLIEITRLIKTNVKFEKKKTW